MRDKKIFYILIGIFTMLLIGFAVSQSVLALLILVDWPVSRFLNEYPLFLCIIAGMIQGFFEEGGRYFAFTKILKSTDRKTSIFYGIGHGGIELLYTLVAAITSNLALAAIGIELVVRTIMFGAQIAFSVVVFASAQNRKHRYLFYIAVLWHAALDAFALAVARDHIAVSVVNENSIYVIASIVLMLVACIIYKKMLPPQVKNDV